MKKVILIFTVIVAVALAGYFLMPKEGSDNFLKQQAVQSALFPALGPIFKERDAQPVKVIFTPQAFGVVVNLMKPIGEHSEREDYRAKLTVAAREWAKGRPELQGLQAFVTFQDELDAEKK